MKLSHGITLLACTALLAACHSNNNAPATAEKSETVATVNGKAITKHSIDTILKQTGARLDNEQARKAILDQLELQILVAEEAEKKGLDKSPDVVEQIDVLKQSVLANAFVQDYLKNNPVSDAALKAEYEKIKASMSGSEYKARHILVATEAEAKDIIAKLKKAPESFASLAQEKSLDPGSKEKGGDLGWFDLTRMVQEFGAAVSKLEKGKFTEAPVQTQFGYHVIWLEDTRPIQAPAFDDIKANLTKQVQQQNLQKLLDDLKSKAKIDLVKAEATPKDQAPAK